MARRLEPVSMLLGAAAAGLLLLSVLYGARRILAPRIIDPVLSVRADDVARITISCREANALPWTRKITRIDDPDAIRSITDALHRAVRVEPSHPQCSRHCAVELAAAHDEWAFAAAWSCLQPTRGALLYFHSNGDWGLLLGTYASEELEPALSAAIATAE